jgi:hypothetical protein
MTISVRGQLYGEISIKGAGHRKTVASGGKIAVLWGHLGKNKCMDIEMKGKGSTKNGQEQSPSGYISCLTPSPLTMLQKLPKCSLAMAAISLLLPIIPLKVKTP